MHPEFRYLMQLLHFEGPAFQKRDSPKQKILGKKEIGKRKPPKTQRKE